MIILAFDTTSEHGSIALARDGAVVAEEKISSPDGYGHVIYGEIERFLNACGVALHEVDLFAAAAGPGSFTGVRVGLAAAKGLAATLGRRAVGVSNLQALARTGKGAIRAAVIDARRGEVFAGVFDAGGGALAEEVVSPLEAWKATVPEGAEYVQGAPDRMLAGAIAEIAWQRWQQGENLDPAAIDANYVRKSDAEIYFVEK